MGNIEMDINQKDKASERLINMVKNIFNVDVLEVIPNNSPISLCSLCSRSLGIHIRGKAHCSSCQCEISRLIKEAEKEAMDMEKERQFEEEEREKRKSLRKSKRRKKSIVVDRQSSSLKHGQLALFGNFTKTGDEL